MRPARRAEDSGARALREIVEQAIASRAQVVGDHVLEHLVVDRPQPVAAIEVHERLRRELAQLGHLGAVPVVLPERHREDGELQPVARVRAADLVEREQRPLVVEEPAQHGAHE
jgi:hypothetical protein